MLDDVGAQQPKSRDGVPLMVGMRVYTRLQSDERFEIVMVGRNTVIVAEDGDLSAEHASLCLVHSVSKLILWRDSVQHSVDQMRRDLPTQEKRLEELNAQIAIMKSED